MQFCTLNEAWGHQDNFIKNNTTEHTVDTTISETSIASPVINEFKYKKNKKSILKNKNYYNTTEDSYYENFTDTINDSKEREKLIQRVLKSRRCRDVLRNKFRPNLINKLILILDDYRDVLVLILIGFCILIFLNMLNKINR